MNYPLTMKLLIKALPGDLREEVVFMIDGERVDTHLGIKKLRKSKGWTQPNLAWEMGVSLEIIKKWESGRYPVPPMALKLMMYLSRD